MKTRLDFVSNSSSSSFIISFDSYEASNIFSAISKKCIDEEDEYHLPGLVDRNKRILEFCADTFQLLFIGTLRIETKKVDYTEETFKAMYDNMHGFDAHMEFELYKTMVDNSKTYNDPKWKLDIYGADEKVNDNHYIHYENVDVTEVIVSNDRMEYDFNRYHFSGLKKEKPEDKATIERRVEAIINAAKFKHDNEYHMLISQPDIYCITLDTIANTRNLIETGHKIIFDSKWQNLDLLEKKLKDGDKIMYVRVAYQGDGQGDFYIYDETSNMSIGEIDGVDVLGGECL